MNSPDPYAYDHSLILLGYLGKLMLMVVPLSVGFILVYDIRVEAKYGKDGRFFLMVLTDWIRSLTADFRLVTAVGTIVSLCVVAASPVWQANAGILLTLAFFLWLANRANRYFIDMPFGSLLYFGIWCEVALLFTNFLWNTFP